MKDLLENKVFRICLVSVVVIIIIMLLIALFVGNTSKVITEYSLVNAAKKYYENNSYLLPKEKYDSTTVSLPTLVSTGYINEKSEGSTCPSYVTVTNLGSTYDYNAVLMCNNSNTPNITLMNKLLTNNVTSGSGLYNMNGSYIFRGENPNNYVKLGNLKWRVMSIEGTSIKLVYDDILYAGFFNPWDDRYNKDLNEQRGINDYVTSEKSRLKEYLDNFLSMDINGEVFNGKFLSLLTKHSVCTGKVNIENGSNNACSNTLDNERVSTITVNDYINTSLDSSCSFTNSINCQNYNFLSKYGWTINANSSNSYEAYYIDEEEGLKTAYTSLPMPVRPVITIKNNVIYVSGSGTELDPYIVK